MRSSKGSVFASVLMAASRSWCSTAIRRARAGASRLVPTAPRRRQGTGGSRAAAGRGQGSSPRVGRCQGPGRAPAGGAPRHRLQAARHRVHGEGREGAGPGEEAGPRRPPRSPPTATASSISSCISATSREEHRPRRLPAMPGGADRRQARRRSHLRPAGRDSELRGGQGYIAANPARGVRSPPTASGCSSSLPRATGRWARPWRLPRPVAEDWRAVGAIWLIALTGASARSEIIALQLDEIDLAGRCIRYRDTKAGEGETLTQNVRPLGAPAIAVSRPSGEAWGPSSVALAVPRP